MTAEHPKAEAAVLGKREGGGNTKKTAQTRMKQLLNNNFTKKIWTDKFQAKRQLES